MDYSVDYFINKFEAIPDELWMTGDWFSNGRSCAMGHCGSRIGRGGAVIHTEEGLSLSEILGPYLMNIRPELHHLPADCIPLLNDSYAYSGCDLSTPKSRILAALYDIKKIQEPKQAEPKVIYKTVRIAEKITEYELVSGSN